MRTILKKLKKRGEGFSLAETLIAILILLMVSSIVAAALPTASYVYQKTVDAANAQVLLSTVMTELRNELSDAVIESPKAGDEATTTITYMNGSGGYRELSLVTTGTAEARGIKLTVREYDPADGKIKASTTQPARLLVNSTAATNDLVVSFKDVSISDGVLTFTDLTVKKLYKNGTTGNALAECASFAIRGLKQPVPASTGT